jgi:hypothetical protein
MVTTYSVRDLSFEYKDVRHHTKRELPEYKSPQEGSGAAKDQPILGGCLALNAPWGIGWKSDSSEHRLDYSKYKFTVGLRILTCAELFFSILLIGRDWSFAHWSFCNKTVNRVRRAIMAVAE